MPTGVEIAILFILELSKIMASLSSLTPLSYKSLQHSLTFRLSNACFGTREVAPL